MTNQTFNLDLIPQGVPPIVHVSQYDKGQSWEIHLYENGIVFPVPANTSAAIQGTKPDSTGFQFPAVITEGDNVVTFTLEQQMTVFSGDIDCELVLVNGDDQVATINFILSVEPTTLDDDTVISETQLPLIEQAAELGAVINNYATQIHADAETASTAATTATSAATTATSAATTATSAAESTAADAATATQAADDAAASQTAAASSASNATTSETNAAASATAAASSASTAESAAQTAQGAMNGKLSTYTDDSTQWDATPTAGSTKPVTSGGVKAQFDSIGTQIADINDDIADVDAEIADLHSEDSRLSSQISKFANCVKVKSAYGTIPNASSGQVYPQYPEGITYQSAVLAMRVLDNGNNILVNPSWAEVRLYQNNAYIFFNGIPQSSQGGTYWLDFAIEISL